MPTQPIEPHAEMRSLAASWRQLFLALVEAGFDEEQAMRVVVATAGGITAHNPPRGRS